MQCLTESPAVKGACPEAALQVQNTCGTDPNCESRQNPGTERNTSKCSPFSQSVSVDFIGSKEKAPGIPAM